MFKGKDTLIMKQCYWYSNDGTLVLGNGKQRYLHASFGRTASQQIHYRSINVLKILKSKINVLSKWSNTQQLTFNSRKQYWNWEGLSSNWKVGIL